MRDSWFGRRRFLRAAKRCIFSLKGWGVTLFVFAPIALLVMWVSILFSLINWEGALFEILSISLGSFLLLAIKEVRDAEKNRHERLIYQYKYYSNFRSGITQATIELLRSLEYEGFGWEAYNNYDSLQCNLNRLDSMRVFNNSNTAEVSSACDKISQLIQELRDTILRVAFVDFEASPNNSWRYEEANRLLVVIKAPDQTCDITATTITELIRNLFYITASLRRPWRYQIDIARGKLMQDYVERHGIPLV